MSERDELTTDLRAERWIDQRKDVLSLEFASSRPKMKIAIAMLGNRLGILQYLDLVPEADSDFENF